jgi:hypothetical protein
MSNKAVVGGLRVGPFQAIRRNPLMALCGALIAGLIIGDMQHNRLSTR